MSITLRNQILKGLLLSSFLILVAVHLSVPINLAAVDIGRHIKNGQLIVHGHPDVLYKNYYSFTHPDYLFINHHWFFGVMAYALFHLIGFKGLSIFYILLLIISYLFAFDSCRRYSNFGLALFSCVASFLLVVSRPEIRPEGFSVFFVALDFWLLQRFLDRSIADRVLLILMPLIQIFWVNTHIFFIMGPFLISLFLWQARWEDGAKERAGFLMRLLGICTLVCLINPSGIAGMLTPFNGFKKFGYELAENQTAFFMMKRFGDMIVYKYYFLTALMMMGGIAASLIKYRFKAIPMITLAILISLAGFKAVRLFLPLGFLFVPLMGYFYGPYFNTAVRKLVICVMAAIGMVLLLLMPVHPFVGLMPDVNRSAVFFKENHLKGPIFSNYDIGGYLIYHLSDQEKVFVDNRQEAYPIDFFQKVYIPMQEDQSVWNVRSAAYGFNLIYFYRHDLTPWGQDFLINRVLDSQWAPVFVDEYVIIFARRGSVNQGVIDRFELPQSMFKVTHS